MLYSMHLCHSKLANHDIASTLKLLNEANVSIFHLDLSEGNIKFIASQSCVIVRDSRSSFLERSQFCFALILFASGSP
jgi:hypothetical protein